MKDKILEIASQCLSDEEVEQIIKNRFMAAIDEAVKDAFRWGDVKKSIESKIKEVMVPYIEKYDFSEYLPKLDTVLTEIVNSSGCKAEKEILENFKELMIDTDLKEIKITDIFEAWIKQCEKDIDTDGLEVNLDDGPHYEYVECTMEVEMDEKREWSSFQYATVTFENEHDEKLNNQFRIYKYKPKYGTEEGFEIECRPDVMLSSLRNMSEFELFLIKLQRAGTRIIIDKEYDDGEIEPEQEPEADWR